MMRSRLRKEARTLSTVLSDTTRVSKFSFLKPGNAWFLLLRQDDQIGLEGQNEFVVWVVLAADDGDGCSAAGHPARTRHPHHPNLIARIVRTANLLIDPIGRRIATPLIAHRTARTANLLIGCSYPFPIANREIGVPSSINLPIARTANLLIGWIDRRIAKPQRVEGLRDAGPHRHDPPTVPARCGLRPVWNVDPLMRQIARPKRQHDPGKEENLVDHRRAECFLTSGRLCRPGSYISYR